METTTIDSGFSAVNWNRPEDGYTQMFWNQNVRQFWVDEEIPLSDDKLAWMTLTPDEQRTYEEVLAGLTLLDTVQGSVGMPRISEWVPGFQAKAVLSFMGAMEHMHAKSYSSIFSTLCTSARIEALFDWVRGQPELQHKLAVIHGAYTRIADEESLYRAMASSVMLESYLFYSGFFYPLYLAGQGRLTSSGEIISLIIRDEAIHGVYVGLLAQEALNRLSDKVRARAEAGVVELLETLDALETRYTQALYHRIGLEEAVLRFSRYNADKALMNLGLRPHFGVEAQDVNPVVLAGLRTETKNHDFFSTKGNGYIKATRVEPLSDLDFYFPELAPDLQLVVKRDGRQVPFDEMRIVRAVQKAAAATGVALDFEWVARRIVEPVKLEASARSLTVEEIQDRVERGLMEISPEVARAYILYREERARARRRA
ncbi:class 1b ribonucleoside-diphosphate reductase subunit beta [Meiothermus sp.]|uniref:class 1b ribonucleoside-diphosphate reductase subunit beta n=1 Tax=Meiothermus sp. TaxID=1955249 RepID=UPI0021DD5D6F|nr:class 1b ribonucleoside-diphosphate reductase subunit beta [Meiothermus sp.]GIW32771.1 MAG: hypothetical protein KatS3mg072_0104 [Meiothermus sp.]